MKSIVCCGALFWRSRPPRGGRGLKCRMKFLHWIGVKSPPSRGAWIEIKCLKLEKPCCDVAPPLAGGVD